MSLSSSGLVAVKAMPVPLMTLGAFLAQVPEAMPLAMLAGLAGGLCASLTDWLIDGVPLTWKVVGHTLVGALVAGFTFPIGQPLAEGIVGSFDLDPAAGVLFGGFVMGVMGISFIVLLRNLARAQLRQKIRETEADGQNDDAV